MMREADAPEGAAIFDLSFTHEARRRPFALVAPRFVAVEESPGGPEGEAARGLVRADAGPPAPYAAVEAEVGGPARGTVAVGLASADGEHLLAVHDPARQRLSIELGRPGHSRRLRQRKVSLPSTYRLAFVLCENQVTVLTDTGAGWAPRLTERARVARALDLRVPETLARFGYAWGTPPDTAGDPGGPVALGRVRAGLFGMTGIRDLHLVQHADGRPWVDGDRVYLTATCAGTGFFPQAHWGVFTLELAPPYRLEQVGQLFSRRDGLVLGDHAGQVVRDDDHDRWIVATSAWGDFRPGSIHVRHVETTADVLHGVHLLDTVRTPLPTRAGAWDPGLTRVGDTWRVAFVESPSQRPFHFHPALAAGRPGGGWCEDLRLVGAATDLRQCEGPVITRVDGAWWLLASDGKRRRYPVFGLDMRPAGVLDAPYPTNIPHPQLVPLADGDFLMVTFDGTPFGKKVLGYGTHGDLVLMRGRAG